MPTREHLAGEAFALTARYDTAIARWFAEKGEDFPPLLDARVREGRRPALRREPAPAGGLLPAGRRPDARAVDGPPAPRQAAVVQQPARPRRGARRWPRSSRSRRARSSSTTTRAAWRSGGPRSRPTSGRSPATRSARSAASSRSTARSTASSPRRCSQQFVEVLFAPGYDDDALERPDREAEPPDPPERRAARCRRPASPSSSRSPAACSSRTATATARSAPRWRSSRKRAPTDQEWSDMLFAWRVAQAREVQRDRARPRSWRRSASAPGR